MFQLARSRYLSEKKDTILAGVTTGFGVVLLSASQAFAQTQTWSGVCVSSYDTDVATIQGLQCLLGNVFTIIISLIGLAAFVMFVIAAFRYLTSGGNTKGTETARNTMTFAVIGIVVALSGFIVLNLLATFTGLDDVTNISIPSSENGLGP